MSVLSIQPTYPVFTDIDGQPLEAGYIFIGTANLNPITNPINVFFDAALTQPAVQPIRTISGYPSNAGTPARLYVNSNYSIQVQNKNGSVVYSAPAATERYGNIIINSADINFIQAGTGAVTRTAQSKMRDEVNVLDFGAVGDDLTDNTLAFQNALNALAGVQFGTLRIPKGTFYLASEVVLPSNVQIIGEGTGATTLRAQVRATTNPLLFVSGVCFTTDGTSNITLEGISFDGGDRINDPNPQTGPAVARSIVEFLNCSNIKVKNCNFLGFLYSLPAGYVYSDSTYRLGACFAFNSTNLQFDTVEFVQPTYGNLFMVLECQNVDFNQIKSDFVPVGNEVNETPINCWGQTCRFVTIRNSTFANCVGSSINIGGMGNFIVKDNSFFNCKGIDNTNENWDDPLDPTGEPDTYNVVVSGNVMYDMTVVTGSSAIEIGNISQSTTPKWYNVVVSNNTISTGTPGTLTGALLIGGADNVVVSNNTFYGSYIQLNYLKEAIVSNNTINGTGALQTGVAVYTRADNASRSTICIKNNIISNTQEPAITGLGFFGGPFTDLIIDGNEFVYATPPTSGKYVQLIAAGGNPAFQFGLLTIANNRLNGYPYVPFIGSDVDMPADNYNFGSLTTKVGGFTRDMTLASGTQAVTGVGFRPRSVIFLANQSNEPEASIGIASQDNSSANNIDAGSVFSRYATVAGDWSNSNTSQIVADQSTGSYSGVVSSFDGDGFTITWTKSSLPTGTLSVYYLAIQ